MLTNHVETSQLSPDDISEFYYIFASKMIALHDWTMHPPLVSVVGGIDGAD